MPSSRRPTQVNSAAALEAVSQCVRHFCFKLYIHVKDCMLWLTVLYFYEIPVCNVCVSVSICFLSFFLRIFSSLCFFPMPVCFHFILLSFLRYLFSKRQRSADWMG